MIDGSERIRVTLYDRRELWAEVIGSDLDTDLALLKVEADELLASAVFGDSDSLQIGDWLLAIGNPFGLRSTVTAGILSARGRSIDALRGEARIESFLQTDAAVNPGSSGGALVNDRGELIGINTAILSESGRHEGFNFAIPGNLAKRVLSDLKNYGEVRRATLGVYVQTVNDAQARTAGMQRAKGVILKRLIAGEAAMRSGLEVGDILLSIDGISVQSAQQMQEVLSRYEPGASVRLAYWRAKRNRSVRVTLGGNEPAQRAKLVGDDMHNFNLSPEVEQ
ncbi:hypothetical protein A3850_013240 [Lewinella sp. 4G2]|nr:hypothetical protein A3850_013240 [Lewinella sp. 4G2]